MMEADRSDSGMEYHTPSTSNQIGNKASNGNNISNCLDNERNILIFTFPMH